MAELTWGRRFLMCPPQHFGVEYSINPWMDTECPVDRERAHQQWQALHDTLTVAGAHVEILPAQPDLPDLVFTANAGLVDGADFVVATFRFAERQGERSVTAPWFAGRGFAVRELPEHHIQEGAGDALPFNSVLVGGYGPRSRRRGYAPLAESGIVVVPVRLTDPRLYHLDLVFCPLDDRRALVAPAGLDRAATRALAALVPEPIVIDADDALRFTANSVVVGSTLVMPHVPAAVGRRLERAGFDVVGLDMSEFVKAGGACRCLTLALDTRLSPPGHGARRAA